MAKKVHQYNGVAKEIHDSIYNLYLKKGHVTREEMKNIAYIRLPTLKEFPKTISKKTRELIEETINHLEQYIGNSDVFDINSLKTQGKITKPLNSFHKSNKDYHGIDRS